MTDARGHVDEERRRASPGDLKERRLANSHWVWHEKYSENKKMWMLHAAALATFSASISRLSLHISKPYSVADIMVALAFVGIHIFREVTDGKTLTKDGVPIVVLVTIVSLAEACFALVVMTLTPLSPTAGGAITLLVAAWLEASLTGTKMVDQVVPRYRVPLLLLNVFVALDYSP